MEQARVQQAKKGKRRETLPFFPLHPGQCGVRVLLPIPRAAGSLRMMGFVDVYTKPVLADDLYLAVRRVMDRKPLTDATGTDRPVG